LVAQHPGADRWVGNPGPHELGTAGMRQSAILNTTPETWTMKSVSDKAWLAVTDEATADRKGRR
jgi:hypothetical protein